MKAGTGAIAKIAVLALPDFQHFLQQVQGGAHRARTGVRAKILAFATLGTAVQTQSGPAILAAEINIGIGFIVFQADVIWRPVLFDQVVLQQQRIHLGSGHRDFNVTDAIDQGHGLRCEPACPEVAGHPVLQVLGLAHVQQLTVPVEHLVDARPAGQGGEKGLGVKFAQATIVR